MLQRQDNGSYTHAADPGEQRAGYRHSKRVSVTDEEAEVLAGLVRGMTVLEIGTGLGVSTRAMAATARTVVTIDTDPWIAREIAPHLPGNVVFGNNRVTALGWTYDFAFIDGEHSDESVRADIDFVLPLIRRGSRIAFHDCHGDNGVSRAVAGAGLVVTVLPTVHKLAISEGAIHADA